MALDLVAFGETIIRYLVAVDLIMLGAIVLELTTTLVLETLVVIIFLTVTLPALLVVFLAIVVLTLITSLIPTINILQKKLLGLIFLIAFYLFIINIKLI